MKHIAWQILWALNSMHGEDCIHGDIKLNVRIFRRESSSTVRNPNLTIDLQNVLIVQRPPNLWSVKVCDLGLSKRVEQAVGGNASTSIHFSPGYCPPEKTSIYDSHENIDGYKADMWCFGELVLQALTGKPSFKNAKDLYTWCQTGEGYPDQVLRELQVSEDAIDFLHSVMACDPAARPTAEVACEHRWWGESDVRPVRGRPASILHQLGNLSRRSAPDMRFPLQVYNETQSSRKPQQYFNYDARYSYTLPYPRNEPINSHWTTLPPRIDPYGGYQHPSLAISTSHMPMALYAPPHQQHSDSDYTTAKPEFNSHQARSSRDFDTRFLTAPHHRPYVLRQHESSQSQITSGSYDGSYGPQPQDSNVRKQVRFAPVIHDRSLGSPGKGSNREGQTQITPAQKKPSLPDSKGLKRVLTLGDLTIDANSDQPVRILVDSGKRKSNRRAHTSQILSQNSIPGRIFVDFARGRPHLNSVPRTEETIQLKRADAQVRRTDSKSRHADDKLGDAISQLLQKEEEIAQLAVSGTGLNDVKGNEFLREELVPLGKKIEEAKRLREAVTRLRGDMNENSRRGELPAHVVTWQRTQAGNADKKPRTGENREHHRDPSWPWLGDGGWTEEMAVREAARRHRVGLEAR